MKCIVHVIGFAIINSRVVADVMWVCVCNVQTAQAHQQVVEKQVSATLAQLSNEANSHSIASSLSHPL